LIALTLSGFAALSHPKSLGQLGPGGAEPGSRAAPQTLAPRSAGVLQPTSPSPAPVSEKARRRLLDSYGKLPLSFVQNKGQTETGVRYYAQGAGFGFYFTDEKVALTFGNGERGTALDLRFIGANPEAKLEAQRRATGDVNYLTGASAAKQYTNLPTYHQVAYRDLWPGVDMVFRGTGGKLKYEFLVRPGARAEDIKLAYAGAEGLSVAAGGSLLIETPLGVLRDSRPASYQRIDGTRVAVDSRYVLAGGARESAYGFEHGAYNAQRPLVIDPGLEYSTFLGGTQRDVGEAIAVDGQGNAYVTGTTLSVDFPTTVGAFDEGFDGGQDIFVTKLDATASALVYSTFLGGTSTTDREQGLGIAVDGQGNAYLTGKTDSTDFPTTAGAFDQAFNGGSSDAFVTKLNATGSALVYSTFLGGPASLFTLGEDEGFGIAVDAAGSAYVTGSTSSMDFPTTAGAFDEDFNGDGGTDVFVTKLNAFGSSLVYSTYLGGETGFEIGFGIRVDGQGSAYVSGSTASSDFPTTAGAFDTDPNDVFVTKLNAAGSALVYSTYLGGTGHEQGRQIAVDGQGSAYVTGVTQSVDFPTTPGAFDTTFNGAPDVFVTKLNPAGTALAYSTYLGGPFSDGGHSIAVDAQGSAYVTGNTESEPGSTGFPTTPGAFETTSPGDNDAFVTKLNATGSALAYSTYLGGTDSDEGRGIAVDGEGNAYVTGSTTSADFPTTLGARDTTYNGNGDAFVTKLAPTAPAQADLSLTKFDAPDPVRLGQRLRYRVRVQNDGPSTATAVRVEDVLPEEVRFESAVPTQGSCTRAGRTVSCELGSLAAGASARVDIEVAPQSDGTITNTASASATEPDPDGSNNAVEETTTVRTSDQVSEEVPAGGTARTGTQATPSDPVVTEVRSPNAGTVTIDEHPTTEPEPPGFSFLAWQVDISAPQASPEDPLRFRFRLDRTLIPEGVSAQDLVVFRNADPVLNCDPLRPPGSASPDPCVSQRREIAEGDVEITVLTSSASAWNFGVRRIPARLTLAPRTATNTVDSRHCVTATVRDRSGEPIPAVRVRFSTQGANRATGSATTGSQGRASFCYRGALPGVDQIRAFADTNRNARRDEGEPSDAVSKRWVVPVSTSGCKVTNGGRIVAKNGDSATFGGNAKVSSSRFASGTEQYHDHGPAQPRNVHSKNVLAVRCSADRKRASIFGRATINGSGSHNYRIDVKDLGEPGAGTDRYRMRIKSYDSGERTLRAGNVQIR
jgi:uncharacterized repeat protein (TIGR01451 family)